MNRLGWIALAFTSAALLGCPSESTKPSSPTQTPETKKSEAPMVPAGVQHAENPAWEDKEASTEMPELDTTAAEKKVAEVESGFQKALEKACGGDATVYELSSPETRVGYVSYKNKELPVPGVFTEANGFMTTDHLEGWVNVLSIDSGNPVRDARLEKLFFEVENADNATMYFTSTSVTGLDAWPTGDAPVKATVKGTLDMHGKKVEVALPMKIEKNDDQYEVELTSDVLLGFDKFGLIEPLNHLMKACNHHQMGTSAKLQLDLTLKKADCDME